MSDTYELVYLHNHRGGLDVQLRHWPYIGTYEPGHVAHREELTREQVAPGKKKRRSLDALRAAFPPPERLLREEGEADAVQGTA